MPSTRSLCGIVNTSSVGRFGANADARRARRSSARPRDARPGRPIVSVGARAACIAARCSAWRSGNRGARRARRGAFPTRRPDPAGRAGTGARSRPTARPPARSAGRSGNTRAAHAAAARGDDAPSSSGCARCARGTGGRRARVACCTAPTSSGGCVLQLIGIVGVDRQHGVPGLDVLDERLGQPRRELVERIARRMLEAARAAALRRPRASRRAARRRRRPRR